MLRLIFFTLILFFWIPLLSQEAKKQKSHKQQDARSELIQQTNKKVSNTLRVALHSGNAEDSMDVSISVASSFNHTESLKIFRVLHFYNTAGVYTGRITPDGLLNLLKQTGVIFISSLLPPKEELTTGINDPSLNRINFAHFSYPQLNGDSVSVSVKERLFDTADIDLKGRVFKTGLEHPGQSAHAASMATIIGGGANTSPFAKGVAWGSRLSSSSFANLFPDPDAIMQTNKISVQNHSYGTIVENFYGNEAMAYDQQSFDNKTLLHVFSAGNSGNLKATSGPYAGIDGFANLTGNFKHAKNILTVGATDSVNQMQLLSSKGPAHDGRIKPELVAFGEDGSSGAAALVSGTALLLQDTYKKMNSGKLPSSSLVKAVLINSADDIAPFHPDHISGYGSLNAYKAMQTVKSNSFFEQAAGIGQTITFPILVPQGVSSLKVTLCWTDPPATPNTPKAVINDLDLLVRNISNGQSWNPWVLNTFPHKDSLLLPAQRKRDSLNTVEQISLDLPEAGDYSIEISGRSNMISSQSFSVAYQFEYEDSFYFTYPGPADPLIAGNSHLVRWETTMAGNGMLEYATNGNNWRTISGAVDLSGKYFKWVVPDTITTSVLRMTIGSTANRFQTDSFAISPQLRMDVGFNCPDTFLLYWNRLSSRQYRLYRLGSKYLEPFTPDLDTSIILNKSLNPSVYYSVSPLIGKREGIRSNTLNYTAAGVECYIRTFYLQLQTSLEAGFRAELGTLFNVAEVALEKFDGNRFVLIQTIKDPKNDVFDLVDDKLKQGENHYRFMVKLKDGSVIYSDTEKLYHFLIDKPVWIYPNPVLQSQPVNIISNESGRYFIRIFDERGSLVHSGFIMSTLSRVEPFRLSKGLYFIRITDKDGTARMQKLVVY